MTDPLVPLLADALRSAVRYIENRTDDSTSDDDVRALEHVAEKLERVREVDRQRLIDALGTDIAGWFDLDQTPG